MGISTTAGDSIYVLLASLSNDGIGLVLFVKFQMHSGWGALLLVPKDSNAKFRMNADLRPMNATTEAVSWPMPQIDSEIYEFMKRYVLATIDFFSSYWELPLEDESQKYHNIIAPK